MRVHALKLLLAFPLTLVSACIIPTKAGGFAVSGTVVDRCTGAPVEGVTVFLRYHAVNAFRGSVPKDSEPARTNELGKFYIPPENVTLMGGSGGLAGHSDKWPTVNFFKPGYTPGYGYRPGMNAKALEGGKARISPEDYQAMIWEMSKYGENCPWRSSP